MKSLTRKASVGLAFLLGANVAIAQCGDVKIAEMNWASAQLMANVDKLILESGYGCNVELVSGDTMPTFTSLNEKGDPDIAPELWINAVREPLKVALEEGRLISANGGPISGTVGEGWWVPPYVLEKHPELKTVLDVLERPDLFPDAEDPSKGAFVGCPAGWGCQLTNANLFRGFKMAEKGWKLVDPGASAGLDGSMTKAVNREENWFGYYWSPTALIGRHKMVKLDFGVPYIGDEHWNGCIVKPEQECADPQASGWTESEIHTVVTADFAKNAGDEVMAYLKNRVYPGDTLDTILIYMDENQAEGADAAAEFLRAHADVWKAWVPSEVAMKVKEM